MRDGDASVVGWGESMARWLGFWLGAWLIRGAWWTLHSRAGPGVVPREGAIVSCVGGVGVGGA